MVKIPLNKNTIGKAEKIALNKVFDSGYMTMGKVTKKFEKKFAEHLGVKHAIAVTSCTTGLHAVFEGLHIKGQEVLVPDYTYPATAEAVPPAPTAVRPVAVVIEFCVAVAIVPAIVPPETFRPALNTGI